MPLEGTTTLWRYMRFSHFLWLLQTRKLWLSRVDKMDDPWEVALYEEQVAYLRQRAPITPLDQPEQETFEARARRLHTLWRSEVYVSCWSRAQHESHALWRIFCGPGEGVAIRSAVGSLRSQVGRLDVEEIRYGPVAQVRTPSMLTLATQKRKMFDYEKEVRVIATRETRDPNLNLGELGGEYPIDPEMLISQIVVHPEAHQSFYDTVQRVVRDYAPRLDSFVSWSLMRAQPPILRDR